MDALVPVVVLGGFAVVLGFLTWLARLTRRRGAAGAGGALAAFEEAFHATGHVSHHEIRAQAERKAPTGSPDGPRRRRTKE
ncbi:hypothetical protein [Streptomyces phaeofaciens]|uniref:hypothetical protein n=1 Tax=Streptomyces phaeofaciens TaxID=68254 RepID=UPI0036CF3B89